MAARGVQSTTLQKKCDRWKKVLRLGDWDIVCRYATRAERDDPDRLNGGENVAILEECSIPEKIAVIIISRDYFNHEGHGVSWNLDTLILHELCHIIQKMGKHGMSKRTEKSSKFIHFEEHICDSFAAIIYFIYYNKI